MKCDETTSRRAVVCRQIAWLLILALIPASLAAWLHPKRPAWSWTRPAVAEITLADAMRLAPPVIWLDARSEEAYRQQHIPGAILLNESYWEELLPEFMKAWRPGARIVVYCDSRKCNASHEVAVRLRHDMPVMENIFVLRGGWNSWLEAHPK